MKRAIIYFSRLPLINETKSRLRDFLSLQDIQSVSEYLFIKNYEVLQQVDAELILCLTPAKQLNKLKQFLPDNLNEIIPQSEGNLGERMYQAIQQVKAAGFDHIVLAGSDLYDLTAEQVEKAFDALMDKEIVLIPTIDGGYGLIGMREACKEVFDLPKYSHNKVLSQLVAVMDEEGLTYKVLDPIRDIDVREDIVRILSEDEEAVFLAQGEYNANFVFDNHSKLFRIALGSQLHLENQIAYEYHALKGLEVSGVVPKALKLVESAPLLGGKGYLIEEFLPGRPLDYEKDLLVAAKLLAKVHSVNPADIPHLIVAEKPFQVMMDEFTQMFSYYQQWDRNDKSIEHRILWMLDALKKFDLNTEIENAAVINTELNSHNFLMNDTGNSYIIDWEKPLVGEREQDIAHFLAPTTTLWRTDYQFNAIEMRAFVEEYNRWSTREINPVKLNQYLLFTCMRGITWCAMAYVQYNETAKISINSDTYKVISKYLTSDFISEIEEHFERGGFIY